MKSGTIYIKRRHTDGRGYASWLTIKEKHYNSVNQRRHLMQALSVRYLVNNINIVLSVIPRERN